VFAISLLRQERWMRLLGMMTVLLAIYVLGFIGLVFFEEIGFCVFAGTMLVLLVVLIFRKKGTWRILCLSSLAYVAALLPYVVTGAYAHGWAGSYVIRGCTTHRALLVAAAARFAQAHDGRLPKADSMEKVLEQLLPYLELPEHVKSHELPYCPVGAMYARNPKPFNWNPDISDRSISELRLLQTPPPVFTCEYEKMGWHFDGSGFIPSIVKVADQLPKLDSSTPRKPSRLP
jgi:hypothetical protein